MKKIRSPGVRNVYRTVQQDGFNQIMIVLRDTSVKPYPVYESHTEFKKMKPFKGEQLSFL